VPDDIRRAAPPVAVISYRYWRSRFAGDRAAIGRVVQINNVPVTIVGVLPEWFTGVQQPSATAPDVSVPLALDPQLSTGLPRDPGVASSRLDQPTYWWLQVMGRLGDEDSSRGRPRLHAARRRRCSVRRDRESGGGQQVLREPKSDRPAIRQQRR